MMFSKKSYKAHHAAVGPFHKGAMQIYLVVCVTVTGHSTRMYLRRRQRLGEQSSTERRSMGVRLDGGTFLTEDTRRLSYTAALGKQTVRHLLFRADEMTIPTWQQCILTNLEAI